MDFFERQQRAHRRTGWLVLYFSLAVISLVVLTALLVLLVLGLLAQGNDTGTDNVAAWTFSSHFSWELMAMITLAIASVILIAALYKSLQLRRGGVALAEAMGGRRVITNSDNPYEQQVLHVVEEMAIASGTPVPVVYLLEEQSINAFAAGYTPGDAVIGVTRGCIERLDRHELQGVVAHEFSHILHGDMRLNTRLIVMLYGILVIGILGYQLLRTVSRTGYRSRSGKSNGALLLLILGGGLTVIGYAGTFFGQVIKAAVSRQREFLADAAAVQFTRNPEGIADALKKIAGAGPGSEIINPQAGEASHLFFGQVTAPLFSKLLATHPPLHDRIRRIEPLWDGQLPPLSQKSPPSGGVGFSGPAAATTMLSPEALVGSMGSMGEEHLALARRLLETLPEKLQIAAREPFGARAVSYLLLIDPGAEVAERQWQCLQADADPQVYQLTRHLAEEMPVTRSEWRLPLLELCLPALRELSPGQSRVFKSNLTQLIKADESVSLQEWVLYRILLHGLVPTPVNSLAIGRVRSLKHVAKAVGLLLSATAHAGASSLAQAQASFAAGKVATGLSRINYINREDYQLRDLSQALAVVNRLHPLQKPRLLKAVAHTVAADQQIRPLEVELVRAFAAALDCPAPLLRLPS